MEITLQYFDGCPGWRAADANLREALRLAGIPDAEVRYQKVETPQEARRVGFRGSPSLLIDGEDPFADPGAPAGLSCRIYQTPSGPAAAPSTAQLHEALRRRRDPDRPASR
ncbi:MAG TPA: hypothetical protein VG452_07995 [Egibacteraceae bacterium]|nr:hypothetical protein [Egibacteraceae bacterium]